jgi:hypothetical protein
MWAGFIWLGIFEFCFCIIVGLSGSRYVFIVDFV